MELQSAAVPIIFFFLALAVLRIKGHVAGAITLALALVVAIFAHGMIEWGGGQRWLHSTDAPESLRAVAARYGGHATLYRGGAREQGVFHPLAPAIHTIHRSLKNAFDLAGIFNPGRMYQDL